MIEQIKNDQLSARKARESFKTQLLTTLLGEITMPGKSNNPDKIIRKFIKNANEIIKVGNTRQVIHAQTEISILEKYLPEEIPEDELLYTIKYIIKHEPDINFGGIMSQLKLKHKSNFNGSLAAKLIKGVI